MMPSHSCHFRVDTAAGDPVRQLHGPLLSLDAGDFSCQRYCEIERRFCGQVAHAVGEVASGWACLPLHLSITSF